MWLHTHDSIHFQGFSILLNLLLKTFFFFPVCDFLCSQEGDTYLYPQTRGVIYIPRRRASMSKANFPSISKSEGYVKPTPQDDILNIKLREGSFFFNVVVSYYRMFLSQQGLRETSTLTCSKARKSNSLSVCWLYAIHTEMQRCMRDNWGTSAPAAWKLLVRLERSGKQEAISQALTCLMRHCCSREVSLIWMMNNVQCHCPIWLALS